MFATGIILPPEGDITLSGARKDEPLFSISLSLLTVEDHKPLQLKDFFSPVLHCMICVVRYLEQRQCLRAYPGCNTKMTCFSLDVNH